METSIGAKLHWEIDWLSSTNTYVVFTHWSSINFFTVCVSEAVAHVELVEFGLKGNLKFYNFSHMESYV